MQVVLDVFVHQLKRQCQPQIQQTQAGSVTSIGQLCTAVDLGVLVRECVCVWCRIPCSGSDQLEAILCCLGSTVGWIILSAQEMFSRTYFVSSQATEILCHNTVLVCDLAFRQSAVAQIVQSKQSCSKPRGDITFKSVLCTQIVTKNRYYT